jgi:predicted RNA-binding Zn-ribbon protein involved in translation (DUF1610 family)
VHGVHGGLSTQCPKLGNKEIRRDESGGEECRHHRALMEL